MEFQMQKNQKKDEAEEEKKRRMRLRGELPPEDEEPEEDWDPESIRTVMPYKTSDGRQQFIVSSQGAFNGYIYVCSMDETRPLRAIPIASDLHVTYMARTVKSYGEMITIGYENGNIELIFNNNFEKRMSVKYHDGHSGQITAACMTRDGNFFLSSANDGLIYAFQFDQKCAMAEAEHDALAGVEGANFMA